MKATVHELLCFLLRLSGIPWMMRELYARKKVTIVNYHKPELNVFSEHVQYFRKHYSIITLEQLSIALSQDKWSDLPPKSLIITFDDGHASNERLFDTLSKYQVPTVIYSVAGLIDTKRKFWFLAVPAGEDLSALKKLDDKSRRERLDKQWGHTDLREYRDRDALSGEELGRYLSSGGTVGSHTMFHPLLTRCSAEVGTYEVVRSRQLLEEICGMPVRHFAYPGGDWNLQQRRWVADAGYATARTIDPGWVIPRSDPLALPNFGISDRAGLNKAIVQCCGFWDLLKRLGAVRLRRR